MGRWVRVGRIRVGRIRGKLRYVCVYRALKHMYTTTSTVYVHTNVCPYICTYTYIHTYTHTHYIYIHTYTYTRYTYRRTNSLTTYPAPPG